MNQITRYVMEIYHVNVTIRDTLEYFLPRKDGFQTNAYLARKQILETALKEQHPLSKFLSENGEAGTKIRTNIQDFYDMVYGNESRAVFLENDKVVVDSGYFTQVLDYIVGLHETLTDVCNGFVKHAQTTNSYEENFGELLAKENAFYRCVASMIITDQIHKLFVDFNKEMHASKGQQSPQSTFIANDLRKHIGFFKFVTDHANYDDALYKFAVEKAIHVIDCMGGKEKLDETGEALRKEILDLHETWQKLVALSEADWKRIYQIQVNDLIAFDKAKNEAATNVVEE